MAKAQLASDVKQKAGRVGRRVMQQAADIERSARRGVASLVERVEKEVSRIRARPAQSGRGGSSRDGGKAEARELPALRRKVAALERRLAVVEDKLATEQSTKRRPEKARKVRKAGTRKK